MSGAYMTRGPYGGLVRGCRACRMPLAADLSCPLCGPKTIGEFRGMALLGCDAPRGDDTDFFGVGNDGKCSHCNYAEHAKTCPTLAPDGWLYDLENERWEHMATGCHVVQIAFLGLSGFLWFASHETAKSYTSMVDTLAEACAAALKADSERAARAAEEKSLLDISKFSWVHTASCRCKPCCDFRLR